MSNSPSPTKVSLTTGNQKNISVSFHQGHESMNEGDDHTSQIGTSTSYPALTGIRGPVGPKTDQHSGTLYRSNSGQILDKLTVDPPSGFSGFDLRSTLLRTERELAAVREENAVRASEIETLCSAAQREHEANLRMQARHQTALDDMREEYERQQGQLIEQITVLKGLSESALEDKHRVTEESNRNKLNLTSLIEKERVENSRLMEDYRQQTESLIAEQGREVAGLRHLLEMAREEEEKLVNTIKNYETRWVEQDTNMLKADAQLSDERLLGQKRLREQEQRHSTEMQAANDKFAREIQTMRQQIIKLMSVNEGSENTIRSLNERLKVLDQHHEQERRRLKDTYQADINKLQDELRNTKERGEKAAAAHRREVEKIEAADEAVNTSLRRNLEAMRQEKSQALEEARNQRTQLIATHEAQITKLHSEIDCLKKDISEEKGSRKDAESKAKTLAINSEALEISVARLTTELEEHQIESRTKQRDMEHNFNRILEDIKDEVREAEGDNVQLRHQLKKVDLELQRLLDDCEEKQNVIDHLRSDIEKEKASYQSSMDKAQVVLDEIKRQNTRSIDTLHGQKIQLEAECGRLQRLLGETESRLSAANTQLSDERKALERSTADIQALRTDNSELRSSSTREHKRVTELTAELEEAEEDKEALQKTIVQLNVAVQEAQQQVERVRKEQNERMRYYEDHISEIRNAARLQIDKMEADKHNMDETLRHSKDEVKNCEITIHSQKEEISRWQRECIAKDELHVEALRQVRQQQDNELDRLDDVMNQLRDDLVRVQQAKNNAQKETAEAVRENEGKLTIMQDTIDAERAAKHRLHDELRNKEQLNAELQGTVRLLHSRLASKDEEIQRLDQELQEYTKKVHDAHATIGKKDAIMGQMNAKIRVFEHSCAAGGSRAPLSIL